LLKKYPVHAHGIEYKCVTAVIYREINGRIAVSAELLDKCKNSVSIVELDKIEKVCVECVDSALKEKE
jgi:hypothetical protein